jgi:hypothetical protein
MKSLRYEFAKLMIIIISCTNAQSISINFESTERNQIIVQNYDNLTSIGGILELFKVEVIGSQWTQIHDNLRTNCSHDMAKYLNGLDKMENWAIKSKFIACFCQG